MTLPAVLAACASSFVTTVPPPSDGLRQAMRDMEVTVTHASLAETLDRPIAGAGEGAAIGAVQGAGASLYVGAQTCTAGEPIICLLGFTLGVLAAPVVGTVGAVAGGVMAHDRDEVLTAHDRLLSAAAALDPVQGLQDAVAGARAPQAPRGQASPADRARLQLAIENFGLHSQGAYEPEVWFVMTVSGRLVREEDNEELYWRIWSYEGPRVSYFSLAAGAPDSLNTLAEGAYRSTAEHLLFDLLDGSVDEALPGASRTVSTVAAKYMRRGSELREYDLNDALNGGLVLLTAGRPARWPDLPVDNAQLDTVAPPEPEPVAVVLPPSPPEQAAPKVLPAVAVAAPPTGPAEPSAIEPGPPPADGRWDAHTSRWSIRVELDNGRFEGNAYCRARNQRYLIAGSVGKDGSIDGSGRPVRGASEAGQIHIQGLWPSLVLPARVGCAETSVKLVPD